MNKRIARRAAAFTAKGKMAPQTKSPTVVVQVQSQPNWEIRAVDLLHRIGRLTTPASVNMAQLSASWATRRYFWAIAEGNSERQPFRLSDDARLIDFHQKTLLSDEFGIGMAGLLLERLFDSPSFVDVSVALNDPTMYQDISQTGDAQPDYLMWGENPEAPYYIVECKGSQTNPSTSMDQIRRGLEQVPSIVFAAGIRRIATLVIATCMTREGTTVYVVDPPNDKDDSEQAKENVRSDKISERTNTRTWKITNTLAFERRTTLAKQAELLKWAGQFSKAMQRDRELDLREFVPRLPDLKLEKRQTQIGIYQGHSWTLFPELGAAGLKLFTGVEEELLMLTAEDSPQAQRAANAIQGRLAHEDVRDRSPFVSFSSGGTCMIVEGLD